MIFAAAAITTLVAVHCYCPFHPSACEFQWITQRSNPPATFRIRYSSAPNHWCEQDKVEVAYTACLNWHPENDPGGTRLGETGIPNLCRMDYYVQTNWDLTYLDFTEVINDVETLPEHGPREQCP